MVDALPWLLLDGLALLGLWCVFSRSIYARRLRLTWARVGVIWRVSRIAGQQGPPMAPDAEPPPALVGELIEMDEQP